VQVKGQRNRFALSTTDSLDELRRLAQTAGLQVIGQTYQSLDSAHPVRSECMHACLRVRTHAHALVTCGAASWAARGCS